jgi:hypothetical protein
VSSTPSAVSRENRAEPLKGMTDQLIDDYDV